MGLDVAARLFEVEFRQRRVVGTGAGDHHVVDRRGSSLKNLSSRSKSVASKAAVLSAPSFARGALEALGIPGGEDHVGPLSACSSGRFEPDAGATADHDDGLPEEFRFALDGRGGGCGAHDSSDQQSKIAFGSKA